MEGKKSKVDPPAAAAATTILIVQAVTVDVA